MVEKLNYLLIVRLPLVAANSKPVSLTPLGSSVAI